MKEVHKWTRAQNRCVDRARNLVYVFTSPISPGRSNRQGRSSSAVEALIDQGSTFEDQGVVQSSTKNVPQVELAPSQGTGYVGGPPTEALLSSAMAYSHGQGASRADNLKVPVDPTAPQCAASEILAYQQKKIVTVDNMYGNGSQELHLFACYFECIVDAYDVDNDFRCNLQLDECSG